MAICRIGDRGRQDMTDQHEAAKAARNRDSEAKPAFDRERVVLALIGLAGAAVIVAMNVG
jgi:hypothetical protein